MSKIYYVYGHIREDTGEMFYIGKGTKNCKGRSHKTVYHRAYSSKNRNENWESVVKITSFYPRILEELICSDEEISDKEKAWVKEYASSPLVNKTCGGCGVSGYKFPRDIVNKIVAQKIGKYSGANHYLSEAVYIYSATDGKFLGWYPCLNDASKNLNISRQSVKNALKNKDNYSAGYLVYKEDKGDFVEPKSSGYPDNLPVSIDVYDLNGIKTNSFESIGKLSKTLELRANSVSNSLKTGVPYKNMIFKKNKDNVKFNFKTQKSKIKLIMLAGSRVSGKDTFYKILSEINPFYKRIAFADNVKKITDYLSKKLFKLHINELNPEQKEMFRPILISVGMVGRNIDKDFWAKKVKKDIELCLNAGFVPVITDCRFVSEYEFYKKIYNDSLFLINITREGAPEPTEEEKIHGPEVAKIANYHLNWPTNQDFTLIRPMVREIYNKYLA